MIVNLEIIGSIIGHRLKVKQKQTTTTTITKLMEVEKIL